MFLNKNPLFFGQSSYLSRISQIIFVEKKLSCGEMSAFHTECEQFMEFYRSLCRFCSKSMWRKNDKGVVCFWATNFCTQQKLLNKNNAKKNSTLTLIEFVNSERRKWKWICQKWTFRHLEDQSPYQRLAPRRSDSFRTKWGQQGRRRFTRIAQNYLMGAKITLKKILHLFRAGLTVRLFQDQTRSTGWEIGTVGTSSCW